MKIPNRNHVIMDVNVKKYFISNILPRPIFAADIASVATGLSLCCDDEINWNHRRREKQKTKNRKQLWCYYLFTVGRRQIETENITT